MLYLRNIFYYMAFRDYGNCIAMEQAGYIREYQNLLLTLTPLYIITFKDSIKIYDSVLR